MALAKIAQYGLAQDRVGGFVRFKVFLQGGGVSAFIGGGWIPVPFAQFASLVGILTTNNAYYEDVKGMFLTGAGDGMNLAANPIANTENLDFGELTFLTTPALNKKVFGIGSVKVSKSRGATDKTKKTKRK